MITEDLAKIIAQEFSFLTAKYRFEALRVRDCGREAFFLFDREDETLSISYEMGALPLIELFIPSSTTSVAPTPWAAKEGVERSRVFPKVPLGNRETPRNLDDFKDHISAMAAAFETAEATWLNA